MIDTVLDEYAQQIAEASLEDHRQLDNLQRREELQNEWVEWPTEFESLERGGLLPDEPGIEMWDLLSVKDKQTRLNEIVKQLPRRQRQVLMLNAEAGYSIREIGDFQNRQVSQVSDDLTAAQWTVRKLLSVGEFEETEVRLERGNK